MLKLIVWLCIGLFYSNIAPAVPGRPGISLTTILQDTSELNNLIFCGQTKAAAKYLTNLLDNGKERVKIIPSDWLKLAIFSAWSDQNSKSIAAFRKFIDLDDSKPWTDQVKSDVLLYHALMLARNESFKQAADSLLASIAVRPKTGLFNRLILADSYGQLARYYKKTGDHTESVKNFERSISANRKLLRNIKLAEDLSDMSSEISKMNPKNPKADSVLLESLTIYKAADSMLAVAQVYHELGILLYRRGDIPKSLANLQRSLAVKNSIRNLGKQEFIVVMNNIGSCYQAMGIGDSARHFFSKAIEYSLLTKRNPTDYYANLGANYGLTEDYTKALFYFQKAIHFADTTCDASDVSMNAPISHATPTLAEYEAFKGHTFHRRFNRSRDPEDLVNGLNAFMVALEMIDTLRFMYSFESKPYLSSSSKIHFFNALDMALDLYDITGKKDYLDKAFQLSERNKSATLNEFLRTNKARGFMQNVAPWIRAEDSIKMLINKAESKLVSLTAGPDNRSENIQTLRETISALGDELTNIDNRAKRENPDYFNMVYSSKGYDLEEIRDLIRPGEALIDYTVVHDDRLSLDYMVSMVTTLDTVYCIRDTLPAQFREDIMAFRSTITSYVNATVFKDFARLSHLMYRYFFEPVRISKGIERLVILPDEELGFLPFEVFVSDTMVPKGSDFRQLSYMNRNYQISYISSHEQFYQFRRNPRNKVISRVYAFAPFARQAARMDTINLFPLGNSDAEAAAIAKHYNTRIYEDKSAGEQTLRKAFSHESVISLSTHGIMSLNHPMESRLLLNPSEPDGSLYLFEMLSVRINSPLVILNACNTGMGKLQVGEGIMSMARGFQYAGVPSLITTLWPIDDQSSAIIMGLFFENLHKGMDKGEALMKARNSYIDQATRASGAPYFWAGQVLIGDPGPLTIRGRSHAVLWFSLFAVTLLLAGLIYYFKKRR